MHKVFMMLSINQSINQSINHLSCVQNQRSLLQHDNVFYRFLMLDFLQTLRTFWQGKKTIKTVKYNVHWFTSVSKVKLQAM